MEGKYQKRQVEAVAREYRKWRMFHREKFVSHYPHAHYDHTFVTW